MKNKFLIISDSDDENNIPFSQSLHKTFIPLIHTDFQHQIYASRYLELRERDYEIGNTMQIHYTFLQITTKIHHITQILKQLSQYQIIPLNQLQSFISDLILKKHYWIQLNLTQLTYQLQAIENEFKIMFPSQTFQKKCRKRLIHLSILIERLTRIQQNIKLNRTYDMDNSHFENVSPRILKQRQILRNQNAFEKIYQRLDKIYLKQFISTKSQEIINQSQIQYYQNLFAIYIDQYTKQYIILFHFLIQRKNRPSNIR